MKNYRKKLLLGFLIACTWLSLGAQTGSLSHYRINDKVDYWLWQATSERVETLYDAAGLGTGETARWLDSWTIARSGAQFDRHSRRDLRPLPGQPEIEVEAWFDQEAQVLRTLNIVKDKGRTQSTTTVEVMPQQAMLWQRDMGIYFAVFFPRLSQDNPPFNLLMSAYEHMIWFLVKPMGEATINGVRCGRFAVEGQGLWSGLMHQATVWIALDGQPRMVRLEQTIALSWTLSTLRIELVESKNVRVSDWKNLQKQELLDSIKETTL